MLMQYSIVLTSGVALVCTGPFVRAGYAQIDRNASAALEQNDEVDATSDTLQGHAEALMRYGQALEAQGAIDKAMAVYQEVIRKYPNVTYGAMLGEEGRYSDDASARLIVLRCRKERGADFAADSEVAVGRRIRDAMNRRDVRQLAETASCAFTVGKAETDDEWQASPKDVMPVLIRLGTVLDWKSRRIEGSGETKWLVVPSKTKEGEHTFITRSILGRWNWVGYRTTDERILGRLRSIEGTGK